MKLFEDPDFEPAILRVAEHCRPQELRPAIIEKDYYVTEALRIISVAAGYASDEPLWRTMRGMPHHVRFHGIRFANYSSIGITRNVESPYALLPVGKQSFPNADVQFGLVRRTT
jgi:hypothetical protein